MKIVITKCDEPAAWYSELVGNAYWVLRETKDSYYVNDSNYVLKEDAEILPEYDGPPRTGNIHTI